MVGRRHVAPPPYSAGQSAGVFLPRLKLLVNQQVLGEQDQLEARLGATLMTSGKGIAKQADDIMIGLVRIAMRDPINS